MAKNYKLLHLITEFAIGGATDNALLNVKALNREKYIVHMAGGQKSEWQKRALDSADKLHFIKNMCRNLSPLRDFLAFWEIFALIRKEGYQIVHTHSSKAGLLGRVAARLAGTPVIVHTVHGFAFNDITFAPWLRELYIFLERFAAKLTDKLIMVAQSGQEEARRNNITYDDKMCVIYNGIDIERFGNLLNKTKARERLGLDIDKPVIGTIGRLSACNAPTVFVDAAKQLMVRYPDLHVLIVGDGEMRLAVEKATQDEPHIHLLGHREDIPAILAALDVFLLTSLWGGLPRTVTEALAANVPVVASPINGVPELVEDGVTGLHARPGNAQEFAEKTAVLLDNPELARRLTAVGHQRVKENFSVQKMVSDLENVYDNLLRRKGLIPANIDQSSP